jgi:hypothetical protein
VYLNALLGVFGEIIGINKYAKIAKIAVAMKNVLIFVKVEILSIQKKLFKPNEIISKS